MNANSLVTGKESSPWDVQIEQTEIKDYKSVLCEFGQHDSDFKTAQLLKNSGLKLKKKLSMGL